MRPIFGSSLVPTLGLFLAAACSSAPRPETPPARPPTPPPLEGAESAPKADPPKRPPTVVVIDPGGGDPPQTLAEAARAERERRKASTRPPVAVITDKNLAEYAEKGELTIAHPAPGAGTEGAAGAGEAAAAGAAGEGGEAAATAGAAAGEAATDGPRDEAYWRGRAKDVRVRWRQAVDEIGTLEKKAADLRWQFYAEDDPAVRDQQIKPEWDRVLDDLRRARQDARAFEGELADLMEEGRRDGALPGWLGEGVELEPEPAPSRDRGEAQPADSIEPPVVEESPP